MRQLVLIRHASKVEPVADTRTDFAARPQNKARRESHRAARRPLPWLFISSASHRAQNKASSYASDDPQRCRASIRHAFFANAARATCSGSRGLPFSTQREITTAKWVSRFGNRYLIANRTGAQCSVSELVVSAGSLRACWPKAPLASWSVGSSIAMASCL